MSWELRFTAQARRDAKKLAASGLKDKAAGLMELLREDPFVAPPPFEKLKGDLEEGYSRRINIQDRLVYQVLESGRAVKVLRMWTHYE